MDNLLTLCRLCGVWVPCNELNNLDTNEELNIKINRQLARLNINVDFNDIMLPKTVCVQCLNSLECAFYFVTMVEQAQESISQLVLEKKVKITHDVKHESDSVVAWEEIKVIEDDNVVAVNEKKHVDDTQNDEMHISSELDKNEDRIKSEMITPKLSPKEKLKNVNQVREFVINDTNDTNLKLFGNNSLETIEQLNGASVLSSQAQTTWKDCMWQCSYCETRFPNVNELTNHSMQHHSACNAYQCTICNIKALKLKTFISHLRKHKKYVRLRCLICPMSFSTLFMSNKHRSTHCDDSDYVCDGCNSFFTTEDEYNKHTSTFYIKSLFKSSTAHKNKVCKRRKVSARPHAVIDENNDASKPQTSKESDVKDDNSKDVSKTYDSKMDALPSSEVKETWKNYIWQCQYCGRQCLDREELLNHMMQQHTACSPSQCTDCRIRKVDFKRLLKHIRCHRKDLQKCCFYCPMTFASVKGRINHTHIHESAFDYMCKGCYSGFTNKEEYYEHINTYFKNPWPRRTSKEVKSDNLLCDICHRTCKTKHQLQVHLSTHTDRKRDYICDICGKSFFSKGALKCHLTVHTDSKPYKCQVCNADFKRKSMLHSHVKSHGTKYVGIEKKFICDYCGKNFKQKSKLSSHLIVHSGVLPYACSYCDKRFNYKSNLKSHVRQHTGAKPYSCDICHREFTCRSNCLKHMKRKHGVDKRQKTRTPYGYFPVNPETGKAMYLEDEEKVLEKVKEVLESTKRQGEKKADSTQN